MKKPSQAGFAHIGLVLLLIIILGVVGGGAYYVWHKNHEKKAGSSPTNSKTNTSSDATNNGQSGPVTSGKGAYSISFPNGWNVLKDDASDSFMVAGETQPAADSSEVAKVTTTTFGGDGAFVFLATIQDKSDVPKGVAKDFTLTNGKDHPIQGKKYVYEYEADTPAGLGASDERIKGDRDYNYVFDLGGGKELRVMYSVYASDPRNLVSTVDQIVNSILLK